MSRLLWLLLLGLIVYAWWRQRRTPGSERRPAAPAPSPGHGELMARCAHCGMHLAPPHAWRDGPHIYCSEAHRDAGPASSGPA